jgi:hypothetical protein
LTDSQADSTSVWILLLGKLLKASPLSFSTLLVRRSCVGVECQWHAFKQGVVCIRELLFVRCGWFHGMCTPALRFDILSWSEARAGGYSPFRTGRFCIQWAASSKDSRASDRLEARFVRFFERFDFVVEPSLFSIRAFLNNRLRT